MKASSSSSPEFTQFKEYFIEECNECGICYKNCYAYKKTKYPIHKYLKKLFQANLDKKNVKKIKKFLKSCVYCQSCKKSCINGLNVTVRLTAIRYELYKLERNYTWVPFKIPSLISRFIGGKRIAYTLRNLTNYMIPKANREKFSEYRIPKSRDVVFIQVVVCNC